MRKLGRVQREVLESLKHHGSWHPRCGWLWNNPSGTLRLMNSLVRAGYAVVEGKTYRPKDPT